MADFDPVLPQVGALDPEKRVNYTLGMVLGEDDFEQEQYYFLERGRQHHRALHGYGTVCGLQVTPDGTDVIVSAGIAVNPQGKVIRVPRDQCANVQDWLNVQANRDRLGGTPPATPVTLNVVLCHRECTVDEVPVPGAPCRSDEDNLADSRIQETFDLHFSLDAEKPDQALEDTVHALGAILARITTAPSGGATALDVNTMEELVRGLIPGNPAGPAGTLLLDPTKAGEVFNAALRVWITEVLPTLPPPGSCCAGDPPTESCVLLGRITFSVQPPPDAWVLVDAGDDTITVDQVARPYLAQTRLLQEFLLHGIGLPLGTSGATPVGGADSYAPVAAGIVFVNKKPSPVPPYMMACAKLTAKSTPASPPNPAPDDGLLLLEFDGYRLPNKKHTYMVKATPPLDGANPGGPWVTFVEFKNDGIVLAVNEVQAGTGKVGPVPHTRLVKLQLMVEISRLDIS